MLMSNKYNDQDNVVDGNLSSRMLHKTRNVGVGALCNKTESTYSFVVNSECQQIAWTQPPK